VAAPAATPAPKVKAPAPSPAAPAPAATDTSSGAALLATMMEAGQSRPSLMQPLRLAQAELAGDTLTLTVAADFVPLAEMHADEYAQLATKAARRNVKVRVSAGAGVSGSSPAGAAASASEKSSAVEARKQDLMAQATREPAVQEALDLFGARIVDVRDTQS